MDTSTILVVFLLVTAATLASFALSHWSSVRGAPGFSGAALSIGTTMLLTAAAIVVLTFVFKGPLWRPNLGAEQQLRAHTTAAPKEISVRPLAATSPLAPTEAATPTRAERTYRNRERPDGSPAATGTKQPALKAATKPSTSELDPEPLRAFNADDPWAATRCVHAYHPGSDATEWKIENGCDVPVGVIVSVCAQREQDCVPGHQMILPAKPQRPITLDEQTVHGYSVRHIACFVATSQAKYLIGAPSEERSTSEWREQFESVRVSDGCLLRVQSSSDESRHTRVPIDRQVGYGNNVP